MSRLMRLVMVVSVLLTGTTATAGPLADRVPADAVVYVGWRGSAAMGDAYRGSRLGAVVQASQMGMFFSEALPQFQALVGRDDPEAAAAIQLFTDVVATLWHHPTAMWVGMTEGPRPEPRIVVMIQPPDAQRAAVRQRLVQLSELAVDGPMPVHVRDAADGLVVLALGEGEAVVAEDGAALSTLPRYHTAAARVQQNAGLCVYINGEALVRLLDAAAAQWQDPAHADDGEPSWAQIKAALGLDGFNGAMMTMGFLERDWAMQVFIDAPAPRRGLMKWFDGEPLSEALLGVAPRSASMVGAGRLDLHALVNDLSQVTAELSPELKMQIDQGLSMLSAMTGVDVHNQLLASLGDEWLYYTDRGVAGPGMLGLAVVNRPRDAQRLSEALGQLAMVISHMLAKQLGDDEIHIRIIEQRFGDVTLHRLAVPFLSPTWAVDGDHLVMGLYPQVVVAACERIAQGGPSILDNEQFLAMRRALGGEGASSVYWADLPQSVADSYQVTLMMAQLYTGMLDMFGLDVPPIVIPTLPTLQANVAPAAGFSWSDEAGWHSRAVTPFPGAELMGDQASMIVAQQSMLVGMMLPALQSARQSARQMESASRLRGIHHSMMAYSVGNRNVYPPDLAALVENDYLSVDYLIAPTSHVIVPHNIMQWPEQERAAWVNANASYQIIVFGESHTSDSQMIAGWLKPEHSDGRAINIVWDDNHVTTLPLRQAMNEIDRRTGKTLGALIAESQ